MAGNIDDFNNWNDLLIVGKTSDLPHGMTYDVLNQIKREVRENVCPYFTNQDIAYYYFKNNKDMRATIYELLIIKAEDSTIEVTGLKTSDTSAYFRRLASRFRTYNSGVLPSD